MILQGSDVVHFCLFCQLEFGIGSCVLVGMTFSSTGFALFNFIWDLHSMIILCFYHMPYWFLKFLSFFIRRALEVSLVSTNHQQMRDALSYRPLKACSGSIEMLHLLSRPRMLASKSKWILDAGCPKVVGSTQIIVTTGSLYPKSQYGCRLCGLCISGISMKFLSQGVAPPTKSCFGSHFITGGFQIHLHTGLFVPKMQMSSKCIQLFGIITVTTARHCWRKKLCTSWYVVYPIICKVSYIHVVMPLSQLVVKRLTRWILHW